MASFSFDSAAVEPQTTNTPIPADTYLCQVTESDLKPLKSGNGTGLSLTLTVLDGPFKGRKVWENLNVQHTNGETQRIAQSQLSALCRAVGVGQLRDTTELHNKPLKVKVKIRKDDQYGDKNAVAGYEAATGGAPAFSKPAPFAAPAAAPATAPAAGGTKAPWM